MLTLRCLMEHFGLLMSSSDAIKKMCPIPNQTNIEHAWIQTTRRPEIIFFHLNHTNPVYDRWSEEHSQVVEMGWRIANQGMRFKI